MQHIEHVRVHGQVVQPRLDAQYVKGTVRERREAAARAGTPIGQHERHTRPPTTPAGTSGMSSVRKRFGPGSMLAEPKAGTSNCESIESESTVTRTGSNGTRSHTRNHPLESVDALLVPTRTRTPGTTSSPGSHSPFPFSSRKTRPVSPARSSEGPAA